LLGGYLPSGRPLLILATKVDKLTPSAQRIATMTATEAITTAFPAQAANVSVVPFSALRRIGIEAAEATIAGWLGLPYEPSDDEAQKERAPRSRGVTGDPKRPS
jgi:GTP-binding protein